MKKITIAALAFIALTGIIAALMLTDPATDISDEELRKRVANANPDWANYHEDLKGQIGSTPIARWKGEPIQASINGSTITVIFHVTGYWAEAGANLPLLIRDPFGKTYADTASTRVGNEVTYTFALPSADVDIDWFELSYPNASRRIAFTDHEWKTN